MINTFNIDEVSLANLEKWIRSQLSKEVNKKTIISIHEVKSINSDTTYLDLRYKLINKGKPSYVDRLFFCPISEGKVNIPSKAPRLVRAYLNLVIKHSSK